MDWFRSHHGAPSDPKWMVVARKAKVQPVVVVSVFWMLLDYASQHQNRGSVDGFDVEVTAAFLGIEDAEVSAVLLAMEEKGIIAGGRIANWEKRQPKRERDDDSAPRVQRHREAMKAQPKPAEATVTPCNATVTPCNATVTPSNAQIDREIERKSRAEQRESAERESAAADPFEGAEKYQPKSVDLQAVLAIRPNWETELNKRLSRKPADNPEGFKRWQVCRWLNGEESPPPTEKPKPKPPVYLDMAQFKPTGVVQ